MQNKDVMESEKVCDKCRSWVRAAWILAWLLTVLGLVKSVFISLDIDESYLVSCAYRLVSGDRLFLDMWEPHQLSAIIPSVFVRLWIAVTGSTQGLVIFLRMAGTAFHLLIGFLMYLFLSKKCGRDLSAFLVLIHVNFLPKWVQSLDFELMAYWAVLGVCMLLISAAGDVSRRLAKCFFAGVLLTVSMLSYPTLILLYPFLVVGIVKSIGAAEVPGGDGNADADEGAGTVKPCGPSERVKAVLVFTAGALIPGLAVIFYILRGFPAGDLIGNVSRVFLNPSHATQKFSERILAYLADGLKGSLIWAALTAVLFFLFKIMRTAEKKETLALQAMIASFTAFQIAMIIGCVFFDNNQFYLQGRYAAFIIPALMIALKKKEEYKSVFRFAILPGILTVVSVMAVTNMSASVAWSKAMPAVLASIYVIARELHAGTASAVVTEDTSAPGASEKGDGSSGAKAEAGITRVLFLTSVITLFIGLVVCRAVLIRVTGCLPVTVKAPLERIENGPAKGIYILKSFADSANREYADIAGVFGPGDKVLYVGAETLLYLDHPCRIASPSTEGTTVYDEYFLTYYEMYPDMMPDYVIYDKNYPVIAEYAKYPSEYVIDEWISDNYTEVIRDTQDLLICGRKS